MKKMMMTMCRAQMLRHLPWALALVALGAIVLAACDSEDEASVGPTPRATEDAPTEPMTTVAADPTAPQGVTVDVYHAEWELIPSVDAVSAGAVTFNATNDGVVPHNFRLAKTELPPDALPADPDTLVVKEDELVMVARSGDIDVGEAEEVIVDLEPGSYVLFCNIAGHYAAGLYAGFTVE